MTTQDAASEDRCCDADGNDVSIFAWVEQIAEDPEMPAFFSHLHCKGEVVGRGDSVVYVRFEGEGQLISVKPQYLRIPA